MVLKIYLGDLVYDTIKTNYVVPLNVAYIAAHVLQEYGDQVSISLFKYPKELEQAIATSPPDVLGLSNYSWNNRLSSVFFKMAKRLNPKVVCVEGGPQIRSDANGLHTYLKEHKEIDYYLIHEGEEPFGYLIGELLAGNPEPVPPGCAALFGNKFIFNPLNYLEKPKEISLPSPYLTGLLDKFLKDPNMIPLLETNRGCPFGCVYCVWGAKTLSKIRLRPLDVIFKEIDYISEHSVGQAYWMICDANFGILPRDVDVSKKIREIMDAKGVPVHLTIYDSKNTSSRNIEIAKIINGKEGYIAIQSADQEVLEKSGRGQIRLDDLKKNIMHYMENNKEVSTDLLLGLPGESAKSHLKTIMDAFDIGFGEICSAVIRLLPGSLYETDDFRIRYDVKTKYRPIFGAYGIYDNQFVFELEESIRSTKDITEEELNSFKVLHWLIYFTWNTGLFKPLLLWGKKFGVNPGWVLHQVANSDNPALKEAFTYMKDQSKNEWFDTPRSMLSFYEKEENFKQLVDHFTKLNSSYIALFYQNKNLLDILQTELVRIVQHQLVLSGAYNADSFNQVIMFLNSVLCKDLLEGEVNNRMTFSGEVLSVILKDEKLVKKGEVEIEVYRPKEYVSFCNFYLNPGGKKDLSVKNLICFFELKGLKMLKNKVKVYQEKKPEMELQPIPNFAEFSSLC